jgi:hypothetical protein
MTTGASGALASAMLSAAIAGRADPARFGRGRDYVRQGAVVDLTIEPGVLGGQVAGSRRTPYDVVVQVPTLGWRATELLAQPGAGALNELVPAGRELSVSCTCPDDAALCKHGVAVALAFAQQVELHPELLATWRGGTIVSPIRAAERAMPTAQAPIVAPAPPDPSPATLAFLGPSDIELPGLPDLSPLPLVAARLGELDVAAVVADALALLTGVYRSRR